MTPTADLSTLMRLVKDRANHYRALDAAGDLTLPEPLPPVRRDAPPLAPVPHAPRVRIQELLQLEGPDLVRAAFRSILWREPSPSELASRTEQLRSASVDPSQLIRQLRYSPEGCRCGVTIRGLGLYRWARAPLKVPILSRCWRVLLDVVWLPHLRMQSHRALAEQRLRIDRHEVALRGLLGSSFEHDPGHGAKALHLRIAALEARLAALEGARSTIGEQSP